MSKVQGNQPATLIGGLSFIRVSGFAFDPPILLCYSPRVQFSPFGHGAAGIFDELVLFAEAVLVLALLIAFLRSRGKRTPNPQTSSTQEDKQTQSPSETARKT